MIHACSKESNAFSIFLVTKRPFIVLQIHISIIFNNSLPASSMVLFLIYAVC